MSTQALKWAWEMPLASPSAKLTLMALAEHADPDGVSWPSYGRLARMTAQSERSIIRRLAEFEDLGLVAKFKRERSDGSTTSNEYRLNLAMKAADLASPAPAEDAAADAENAPGQADTGGCQIGTPEGQYVSPAPVTTGDGGVSVVSPHEPPREVIKPPKAPLPEADAPPGNLDHLDEFSAAYPIPITRMTRVEALWSAMTGDERSSAIAGAKRYADFCAKNPKRSVQDAHRWLGDQGWRGFTEPAKTTPATPAVSTGGMVFVREGSDQWRAWTVYRRTIGKTSTPTSNGPGGTGWYFASEWPPFGRDFSIDPAEWHFVVYGTPEWWAWQDRVKTCAGHGTPVRDALVTEPAGLRGWKFPSLWPPAKALCGAPPAAEAAE